MTASAISPAPQKKTDNGSFRRIELHKLIDEADDRFISMWYAMLQAYLEYEPIVSHSVAGEPLTKIQAVERFVDSYYKAKNGESMTTEQLVKASENW